MAEYVSKKNTSEKKSRYNTDPIKGFIGICEKKPYHGINGDTVSILNIMYYVCGDLREPVTDELFEDWILDSTGESVDVSVAGHTISVQSFSRSIRDNEELFIDYSAKLSFREYRRDRNSEPVRKNLFVDSFQSDKLFKKVTVGSPAEALRNKGRVFFPVDKCKYVFEVEDGRKGELVHLVPHIKKEVSEQETFVSVSSQKKMFGNQAENARNLFEVLVSFYSDMRMLCGEMPTGKIDRCMSKSMPLEATVSYALAAWIKKNMDNIKWDDAGGLEEEERLSVKDTVAALEALDTTAQTAENDGGKEFENDINPMSGTQELSVNEKLCRCYLKNQNEFKETYDSKTVGCMSNELRNILISLGQNFITVISGTPGGAKGALCDEIGNALGLTDMMEIDKKSISRYYQQQVSRKWNAECGVRELISSSGSPLNSIFSYLDYESRDKDDRVKLPYIYALKRIGNSSIDEYFEDFLNIGKEWYRKEEQMIGETQFRLSKNLRILMTINNQEKIDSDEFAAIANIIDVPDAEKIVEELRELTRQSKTGVIRAFYEQVRVKNFEPGLVKEEKWQVERAVCQKTGERCNAMMDLLEESVQVDGRRFSFERRRLEHAISRYYLTARYCHSRDKKPSDDDIKKLVPRGVIIDEECIFESAYREGNVVALDYAFAQRLIPSVTRRQGEVTVQNMVEIVEFLFRYGLFKTASVLKDAVDWGMVKIADELSEDSNNEYIIKKCRSIYAREFQYAVGFATGNAFVEHICGLVNQFRDKNVYTRNVIVNMLICLTQGFITVFSGRPGCGKTSICKILGECLGMANSTSKDRVTSIAAYPEFTDRRNEFVNPERFLMVSTERGWTSKRDFIGYYNPLTEQFDKTNALLYNAFLVMNSEASSADPENIWPPCFVLLDEANLSPMEYYWADFMNLCEEWSESNSIDLGGGRVFHIPESLHFMATINNDHTTEILSPRLIDRANVIDLPRAEMSRVKVDKKLSIRPVRWSDMKKYLGCSENETELETDPKYDVYRDVKAYVEENFAVSISPRTDIAVSRYWTVARRLFTEESYTKKKDIVDTLRGQLENGDPDHEKLKQIRLCVYKKGEIPRLDTSEEYTSVRCGEALIALDYAVAQRVLPKLTDISGDRAFDDLIGLLILLLEKHLYKSAGIVVDMIQRGYDTGFYNFFR